MNALRRTILVIAAIAGCAVWLAVPGLGAGQVPVQDRQPARSALRPAVMGPSGGVSTGHPLTTAAAFGILLKGGNAFDAGVASLIAGGVLEQDLYSLGGEALVLVYPKKEAKVISVVGQGWAPSAVSVDWYLSRKKNLQGAGLDPAVIPGALHAALTVLEKWGTMSFEEVATPGHRLRREGLPAAAEHGASDPEPAEVLRTLAGQPEVLAQARRIAVQGRARRSSCRRLARTLKRMVEAERAAKAKGREAGVIAARDRFYKGDIAREMVAFLQKHGAPFDDKRLRRVLRPDRGAGAARPIAATPSTSTGSAARGPCCCRR